MNQKKRVWLGLIAASPSTKPGQRRLSLITPQSSSWRRPHGFHAHVDSPVYVRQISLFELQRRRVMTRQGELVKRTRKKTKLGERRGVNSNLRTSVSYAPAHYDTNVPVCLKSNASPNCIGAVLLHVLTASNRSFPRSSCDQCTISVSLGTLLKHTLAFFSN